MKFYTYKRVSFCCVGFPHAIVDALEEKGFKLVERKALSVWYPTGETLYDYFYEKMNDDPLNEEEFIGYIGG